MLQNAYFLAKIGVDTAENERNSAENLPKSGNYPPGPLPPDRRAAAAPDELGGGRHLGERAQHLRSRRGPSRLTHQ